MNDDRDLRRKLDGLRETINQAEDRLSDLAARMAKARDESARLMVDGDPDGDASALREELTKLEAESRELRAVLPVLEKKEKAAEESLRRTAVERLLAAAHDRAGTYRDEHRQALERAEQREREAVDSRRKAEEAATRANALADASSTVGQLLGVETAEIGRLPGSRSALRRLLERGDLRKAGAGALDPLKREELLDEEAEGAIRAALAGMTDEDEARRREQARRSRIEAQAQEREEARAEVDTWLTDLLSGGPVARARVWQAAEAAEFARRGGAHSASVEDARRRLGVFGLEREGDDGDRASWWMLPGEVPPGFRRLGDPTRAPASLIQGGDL